MLAQRQRAIWQGAAGLCHLLALPDAGLDHAGWHPQPVTVSHEVQLAQPTCRGMPAPYHHYAEVSGGGWVHAGKVDMVQ